MRRLRLACLLFARLVTDLVLATAQLVWDVYTPRNRYKETIIELKLDGQTDAELMFLAVMIGLTPGTFSLDISDDRSHMQVHAMYVDSPGSFLENLRQRYVEPLAIVMRGSAA